MGTSRDLSYTPGDDDTR